MTDLDSGNYIREYKYYQDDKRFRRSSSPSYTQPALYNSEWIDSPSPSRIKRIMIDEDDKKTADESRKIEELRKLEDSFPKKIEAKKVPKISNWKIFWEMLNDLTGKDKLAKLSQYTLRLLLFHAEKSQKFLSDDLLNIEIINLRYNNKEKQLNLIRNFIKHPANFFKVVIILLCYQFQQRFLGMAFNLSIYRQYLRFGKSPFRLRNVYKKINLNVSLKNGQLQVNNSNLLNRATLSEVFGLYYSIFDESLLLCKIGFYSSSWTTWRSIVGRHESLAWYYDTWLNLYNAYEKLQSLSQQEVDLKILIEVKNKARILSRQILGAHSVALPTAKVSNEDSIRLHDIQFSKTNSYLDIYKNISDLAFNSYTVFDLPLPFETLQIWMGISASLLNSVKVYRETRKRLEEEH